MKSKAPAKAKSKVVGIEDGMDVSSVDPHSIHAPNRMLAALELRAVPELAASVLAWPIMSQAVPKGDGHAVLALPGLLGSDISMALLRARLSSWGYQAEGWGLGRNLGPDDFIESKMLDRLKALADKSGRKVSLVGQSLGGVYARLLAAHHPELVRRVVTLGSPAAGSPKGTNAWQIYEFLSGQEAKVDLRWERSISELKVPSTSVWSRSDAIVGWPLASAAPGPLAESIRIESSHIGMASHPAALYLLADRLALPEGSVEKFEPKGWRKAFFESHAPAALALHAEHGRPPKKLPAKAMKSKA